MPFRAAAIEIEGARPQCGRGTNSGDSPAGVKNAREHSGVTLGGSNTEGCAAFHRPEMNYGAEAMWRRVTIASL